MKTLVLYLGKKYVLSAVNDLLQKYGNNVPKITGRLSLWIERL